MRARPTFSKYLLSARKGIVVSFALEQRIENVVAPHLDEEVHMPAFASEILEMPLKDLMTQWPETISVFVRYRMSCAGCPVSPFHTVVDACEAYDVALYQFCSDLAKAVARSSLTK